MQYAIYLEERKINPRIVQAAFGEHDIGARLAGYDAPTITQRIIVDCPGDPAQIIGLLFKKVKECKKVKAKKLLSLI